MVVAFATHETEQYVAQLRQGAAGQLRLGRPALRTYLRHHLEAGEQFHMGLGPQLYGILPPSSRQAIREHVVAVEDVLRDILRTGVDSGAFRIEDLDGTLSPGPRMPQPAAPSAGHDRDVRAPGGRRRGLRDGRQVSACGP